MNEMMIPNDYTPPEDILNLELDRGFWKEEYSSLPERTEILRKEGWENCYGDIRIHPQIKALLKPLRERELEELEQAILEGLDHSMYSWYDEDGIEWLIDGHHRYEICKKHQIWAPCYELWDCHLGRRFNLEDALYLAAKLNPSRLK